MTNRERFCRIFDFQRVDRPIRWETPAVWTETVDGWVARGTFPAGTDPMGHYHLDPRPKLPANPELKMTVIPFTPPFKEAVIEKRESSEVRQDRYGRIFNVPLRDAGQAVRSDMPQWLEFPGDSPEKWERDVKWRLDPKAHDYGCDMEEESKKYRDNPDPNGLCLCGLYAFWRNMWGVEKLSCAFYDYPDTLHDMARAWLAVQCEVSAKTLSLCRGDYVIIHEDMAYKNGPLIGPNLFRAFMLPYYREFIRHLQGCGLKRVIVDSDGDNDALMPLFIEAGVNGMLPFEVAATNDVREVRRKYPDFFIWGGLDKRVLLRDKETVKREILEKVPLLWEKGGYLPMIDHSLMPCPQENWEYFLETLRGLFPAET